MNLSPQLKKEFIKEALLITIISIVVGFIGYFVVFFLFPERYFETYPFIPIFFYSYALISGYQLKRKELNSNKSGTLKVFLINKVIKVVLSLLILFIYILTCKETAKMFSLVFIAFYFVFLIYDTWFFSKLQKKK